MPRYAAIQNHDMVGGAGHNQPCHTHGSFTTSSSLRHLLQLASRTDLRLLSDTHEKPLRRECWKGEEHICNQALELAAAMGRDKEEDEECIRSSNEDPLAPVAMKTKQIIKSLLY